jgi:hypothetical protein
MTRDKRWRGALGKPPFETGDMITPNDRYGYGGNHKWPAGEYRRVQNVVYHETSNHWTLRIWNPSMARYSEYNPHNFKKQEADMAPYEKTKFFAAKICDGVIEAQIDGECSREGGPLNTQFRDHKSAVIADVSKIIKQEEQWVILQTVALIEGEEPRPPIRVTEYR